MKFSVFIALAFALLATSSFASVSDFTPFYGPFGNKITLNNNLFFRVG